MGQSRRSRESHRYWREAGRGARMPRGVYRYCRFCCSGTQQVAWFIADMLRERGGTVGSGHCMTHSHIFPYHPVPDGIRREARDCLDILQHHYGQSSIICTTLDIYRGNSMRLWSEGFPLRSVVDLPRNVYLGKSWAFGQYTGTGTAPRSRGSVDVKTYAGDTNGWRR